MVKCHELKFLDEDGSKKDVDLQLVSFYRDVILEDLNATEDNRRTLKRLRRKYARKLQRASPVTIDFESSAVRSAYVFYYCPCFTGALISGLAGFLRGVPDFAEKVLRRDRLSFCCLGGGPATEIVAVFSLLEDVLSGQPSRRSKPLAIDAVVVDSDPGWAETANRVVAKLREASDAQAAVELGSFRFLEHDLVGGPVTQDLREALSSSDVVTLVKFLSAIHGPSDASVRSRIIQDICESMPEDGTLFLLESNGWKFLEEVTRSVGSRGGMACTYGPSKQSHRMSGASKRACSKLYSGEYGIGGCAPRSTNKVTAWCKKPVGEDGDASSGGTEGDRN